MPAELVSQVRSALAQAGFQVEGDTDSGVPGLRVIEFSAGALVRWTASDGFTSLARGHAGRAGGDDSMKVLVQAAVTGLLVQLGHTVTEASDDGDLVVLADIIASD
ncbi:hypothetical protein AB0G20_28250 [Streptomyces sp. NPDC024017]|uniref:hypothetical protein n=1 Tax=Streptomyces sp. NPDC024017 TaxID=3154326 RepID=UPI0033FD046E